MTNNAIRAALLVSALVGSAGAQEAPEGFVLQAPPVPFGDSRGMMAIADFNGDGNLDVVGVNHYPSGSPYDGYAYLMLGDGRGHLRDGGALPAGPFDVLPSRALKVIAADFNADGHPDIAVQVLSSDVSSSISVFYGRGDGTFLGPFRIESPFPVAMDTADVNRDGFQDLVGPTDSGVTVLLGTAGHRFDRVDSPIASPPHRNAAFSSVRLADLNGDGWLDLILVFIGFNNPSDQNTQFIAVYHGRGYGIFDSAPSVRFELPLEAQAEVLITDIDGDGTPDVVLGFPFDGLLRIYLGNHGSDLVLAGDTTFPADSHTLLESLHAIDLFSAGRKDILIRTLDTRTFPGSVIWVIMTNDGHGRLTPFHFPIEPAQVVGVADFNNDGRDDLVVFRNIYPFAYTLLNLPPNLSISKTAIGPFNVGSTGRYEIDVRNTGPGSTVGPVRVSDTLPSGTTFSSFTGTGWACVTASTTFSCAYPGLEAGVLAPPLLLNVNVGLVAYPGVTNRATVSSRGDYDASDDQAQVSTNVHGADLAINKSHSGDFIAGANGTYVIAVTNQGNLAADGTMYVQDVLPAGLTFVSGAGCSSQPGNLVVCQLKGPIAPGATISINLTVSVGFQAYPRVTNTASLVFQSDVNTGNNTSSDPTTVKIDPLTAIDVLLTDVSRLPLAASDLDALSELLRSAQKALASGDTAGAVRALKMFHVQVEHLKLPDKHTSDLLDITSLLLKLL
jgi:uncharacterized repeat protein (TIGR01451 family)